MSPPGFPSDVIAELTRASLPSKVEGYIKQGAWNKADVLLVAAGGGRVAVKDYAARWWPVRWSGAIQLSREARAYRRLEGVAGVPRWIGRIDRNAIAIEYVPGIRLPKFHKKHGGVPRVAERIRDLLASIHERGIIHGDLRSRDNILVTPGGDLYLIDFSSAGVFDLGSWWGRLLFARLRRAEERALLKWKLALAPEEATVEERAQHERFARVRRWWPFNRKRDLARKRERGSGAGPRRGAGDA